MKSSVKTAGLHVVFWRRYSE